MDRRDVLAGIGSLVAIAGCTSRGLGSGTSRSPTQTATSADPTPTNTQTATPTETATATPSVRERADFVVAQDGSGDYRTVAKAMQVAQKGDLIAIRSGSYELQSEIPWEEERGRILPRVTLVGVDSDVTLTVTPFNHLSNHIHTALSNTTLRNLTVKTTGDELTLKSSSVINCTLTAPATVGLLRNSHAEQSVEGTKIQNCRVDGSVSVDGDGIVTDTTMAQLRMSGYKNTVKRCTIGKQGPPEVVVFTDTVAGSRILDSTIYGKIIEQSGPNRSDVYHLDEIKRCQFRASGGVNWFFKSVPAKKIWLNAFIGADISLPKGSVWDAGSGTSDPIRLYSKKHKLGNYYSAFKKNDENGDGVIDLPRPIPGKGDVVDQYPLANSDLSQYR